MSEKIWEDIYRTLSTKWWGAPLIALGLVMVVMFGIWNSLPDSTKEKLIFSEISKQPDGPSKEIIEEKTSETSPEIPNVGQSPSSAKIIAYQGALHNGIFLKATANDIKGRATVVDLTLECRKNWNGTSSGWASIVFFHLEKEDPKYNPEVTLNCSVGGPPDGRVVSHSGIAQVRLRIPKSEYNADMEVLVKISHNSKDAWQRWGGDIDRAVRGLLKDVQRESTGVRDQLLNEAKAAGYSVTKP